MNVLETERLRLRRLHVREDAGDWWNVAVPKTIEPGGIHRWMRERRIPELTEADVPADHRPPKELH